MYLSEKIMFNIMHQFVKLRFTRNKWALFKVCVLT